MVVINGRQPRENDRAAFKVSDAVLASEDSLGFKRRAFYGEGHSRLKFFPTEVAALAKNAHLAEICRKGALAG